MRATARSIIAATATALLLAGCGATGPGPFGPRYQTTIPAGSTLVLERALDVPAGAARVFMQDGQIVREAVLGGASRFRPRCSFGLERVGDERLLSTIESDRFRTGRPHSRAYVEARPATDIRVASRSLAFGLAATDRGGPNPGYLTYVIEIPLSSSRQPQVDDFTCKVDRPPNWRGRLGLQAIREAAGDLVTLELAQ